MAERVTRIVASLYISIRRKEYALEPLSHLLMIRHLVSLPLGISSTPFHGVSVKRKLLNVISIFGCFLLILSSSLTGSRKGRMTSRCSGLGPPPMAIVEASEARREEAITDPIQTVMSRSQIVSAVLYVARTGSMAECLRCKSLIADSTNCLTLPDIMLTYLSLCCISHTIDQ